MIIDTHVHAGEMGPFSMPIRLLKEQMDQNKISTGIISSIESCEYQQEIDELFPMQKPQIEANIDLLKHVKDSKGRLYLAFWCKLVVEKNYEEVYEFIKDNNRWVKAMKFHPYYSRLALEDKRYHNYIDIARQLNIPVCVHTANDNLSNPAQLLKLAKEYQTVDFVMVHMGLATDNELAIDCLSKADNLYGDTTWVAFDKVKKAMDQCGDDKMMFGSDAPIDGKKSYAFYEDMINSYLEGPTERMDKLMYKNAKALFKLD